MEVTFETKKTSVHLETEVNFTMHLLCDYNKIQGNEEFMK